MAYIAQGTKDLKITSNSMGIWLFEFFFSFFIKRKYHSIQFLLLFFLYKICLFILVHLAMFTTLKIILLHKMTLEKVKLFRESVILPELLSLSLVSVAVCSIYSNPSDKLKWPLSKSDLWLQSFLRPVYVLTVCYSSSSSQTWVNVQSWILTFSLLFLLNSFAKQTFSLLRHYQPSRCM